MIDIHSHIIPGIDDGSKNVEMTLEMLKNAERDGTTRNNSGNTALFARIWRINNCRNKSVR